MNEPIQGFSRGDVQRLRRVVRRSEGDPPSTAGSRNGLRQVLPDEHYPVKLTAATRPGSAWTWDYTGRPQVRNNSGHGDREDDPRFTGDITLHNTAEDAGGNDGVMPIDTGIVVDAWIERYFDGSGDLQQQWCFCVLNQMQGQAFTVKVAKDGGAAGTPSTAATWSYTVKTLSGDILGTGVTPQRARSIGITNAAPDDSYGLAAYTNSGTLVLLDVFGEYRGKATC